MICIQVDIPQSVCDIDDELKGDLSQQGHCMYLGF